MKEDDDEAQQVYRGADRWDLAVAGGRFENGDVCRKHGVSSATFYKWKATYGGLDVSQARKLKALEDKNSRLKRLLAGAMLENAVLKEVASENWGGLPLVEGLSRMFGRPSASASVGRVPSLAFIDCRCAMRIGVVMMAT